jgi:hypothetical protein
VDLSKLVEIYRRKNAPKHEAELDHFRGLPTLPEAVEAATMAIGPDGKMLRHQRRVGKEVLTEALAVLANQIAEIEACSSFSQLIDLVQQSTEAIDRFGSLAVYDTALRIGAKLNRLPEVVYLHAGTKAGANALGLDTSKKFLEIEKLPEPLCQLEPHEVEDFLCIYKEHFDSEDEDAETTPAQEFDQDNGAIRPATRDSWQNQPFPKEQAALPIKLRFSKNELTRIAQGHVPQEMEDKWFVFLENDQLYFHRSWTGFCIFELQLATDCDGTHVEQCWVNRNPSQYTSTDLAEDEQLLRALLRNFFDIS